MLRKSLMFTPMPITILPWHRRRCICLTNIVMLQCLLVFAGATTILKCVWSPRHSQIDFNKLVRIMYLFDYEACEYNLQAESTLSNIRLPNETYGLNIKAIPRKRAISTVSTRLSSKTRKYIEISIGIHIVWLIAAFVLNITVLWHSKNMRLMKFVLVTFLYVSIAVIIFDISMAIVYIAHIQQSLTTGMILRYSGWGGELKLNYYDDFGGWLPLAASMMWLRGIVILFWNIYCCKAINLIRQKILKKEVMKKLMREGYLPIPEPITDQPEDSSVLYYRSGENDPFIKRSVLSRIFYKASH